MKSLKDIEFVGWGTFLVLFIPCSVIGAAFIWYVTYDTTELAIRIGSGIFLGFICAGFITAGLNEILHRRNVKADNEERKVARKAKKKKKKR